MPTWWLKSTFFCTSHYMLYMLCTKYGSGTIHGLSCANLGSELYATICQLHPTTCAKYGLTANPWIGQSVHKVWISTIHGLSCANLGSEHCATRYIADFNEYSAVHAKEYIALMQAERGPLVFFVQFLKPCGMLSFVNILQVNTWKCVGVFPGFVLYTWNGAWASTWTIHGLAVQNTDLRFAQDNPWIVSDPHFAHNIYMAINLKDFTDRKFMVTTMRPSKCYRKWW